MDLSVYVLPFQRIRSKRTGFGHGVMGCSLVLLFGLAGCVNPQCSTEITGSPQGVVSSVKWATGFGFSPDHKILWVAGESADDTTFWAKGTADVLVDNGRLNRLPAAPLNLATWSTTHVPFVLALASERQWVGCGYLDRVKRATEGPQLNLGGDAGLSEETLLASGADVLTSYPFGDPMEGVERRTGIPVLAFAEYSESHALGRAEYIKLFGWLLGKPALADSLFDGIESRYQILVGEAKREANASGWPSVFTGSESGGQWTAPTEDGLVAQMVADAGGEYAFNSQMAERYGLRRAGTNYEVQLEQCALIAEECDAWGRVVYAKGGWTMADVIGEAPWCDFSSKLVFHCNTAEVDYFGDAILEPDRMLADLISVLHPGAAQPSALPYYQRTPLK